MNRLWMSLGFLSLVVVILCVFYEATSATTVKQPLLPDKNINLTELFKLTNSDRVANNLPPLTLDTTLTQSAQDKCSDMAAKDYWSHTAPNGDPFYKVFIDVPDGTAVGENLAAGQSTAQEIERDWLNSPEHKANIMDARYTTIGFAKCFAHKFVGTSGKDANIVVEHFAEL